MLKREDSSIGAMLDATFDLQFTDGAEKSYTNSKSISYKSLGFVVVQFIARLESAVTFRF